MFGRAWEWIKGHSGLLLAGGVGLVAVWYLFLRGGTSGGASAGPTTVDLTGAGDQAGGGGAAPSAPPNPTSAAVPSLPYPNVDFGPIGAIADSALRTLYESAANVEEQINQATLAGNTDLANSLGARLSNIQQQISTYQPPAAPAAPAVYASDIETALLSLSNDAGWTSQQAADPSKWAQRAAIFEKVLRQQLGASVANVPSSYFGGIFSGQVRNNQLIWDPGRIAQQLNGYRPG